MPEFQSAFRKINSGFVFFDLIVLITFDVMLFAGIGDLLSRLYFSLPSQTNLNSKGLLYE